MKAHLGAMGSHMEPTALLYPIFFVIFSVVGLFFFTSLLIESFYSSYNSLAERDFTPVRSRRWAALAAVWHLWGRCSDIDDSPGISQQELLQLQSRVAAGNQNGNRGMGTKKELEAEVENAFSTVYVVQNDSHVDCAG